MTSETDLKRVKKLGKDTKLIKILVAIFLAIVFALNYYHLHKLNKLNSLFEHLSKTYSEELSAHKISYDQGPIDENKLVLYQSPVLVKSFMETFNEYEYFGSRITPEVEEKMEEYRMQLLMKEVDTSRMLRLDEMFIQLHPNNIKPGTQEAADF